MIAYKVFESFNLGPLTFHTWGIFFALGVVAAIIFALKEAKKQGFNLDKIFDLSLLLLFAGIVGARIGYVIVNWQLFRSNPVEIFKVWDGGLGFISGFLLALLAGWLYLKLQKISFWRVADIFAPALALGYFIARIGCFLVHDHLGKETKFFLAVNFGGRSFHETSIYTAASALILFFVLLLLKRKPRFEGFLFFVFVLWYTLFRFIIEFFQAGPYLFGLTYTAWVAIFTFVIFLVLFVKRLKYKVK